MTSDSFPARVGGNNHLRRNRFWNRIDRTAAGRILAGVPGVTRKFRNRSTLVLATDVSLRSFSERAHQTRGQITTPWIV